MASHRKWLVTFHLVLWQSGHNLICCVPCVTLLRLRAFAHPLPSNPEDWLHRGKVVRYISFAAALDFALQP